MVETRPFLAAFALFLWAALAFTVIPPAAHAQEPAIPAPHVAASLSMPPRLAPPDYLSLVVVDRPLPPRLRCADPNVPRYHEYGLLRLLAPVEVEVFALVVPADAAPYLLLLDNFAVPPRGSGKIDAGPLLRSLGVR